MIIGSIPTKSYAHELGSYMSLNDSKFGYIPIPKNASTTLKFLFKNTIRFSNGYNYHNESNKNFVVCLRDPLDRWYTGVIEHFDRRFKDTDISNPEVLEHIFNKKKFDAHTEHQINFLSNLSTDNIYFFKFGANLLENISRFLIENLNVYKNNAIINISKNISIGTPKQEKIDFLKKYAILNPHLVDDIKDYYSEDYKLFNSVEYYGTN